MSQVIGEHTKHAIHLGHRFRQLATPQFAQCVGMGGVLQGACWWLVTSKGEAANEVLDSRAEHFMRPLRLRLRARTFNLRLSECIHDDGFSH